MPRKRVARCKGLGAEVNYVDSRVATTKSPLMQIRVYGDSSARALVDTGCTTFAVINKDYVDRLHLPYITRRSRLLKGFQDEVEKVRTHGVITAKIELCGYEEEIKAHVIENLGNDLILGLPWMAKNDVVFYAKERHVWHGRAGVQIRLRGEDETPAVMRIREAKLVSASTFQAFYRRTRKSDKNAAGTLCAVSLADINKALLRLDRKEAVDPSKYVPADILAAYPDLFAPEKSMELPPLRPGVDHEVNLQRDGHDREPELPSGALYGMSREELLVLRKTLNDLLDKGFIRASSSSAAAPVLFVSKPGGGIRFCCDYRALNAITKRDRYPLPLISETLRDLASARWFTKLDVVAAFHKIRMAEGHEHKTAFRTRFGLFEWLVCPFGLSGAPAAFQRYINGVLQAYLDDFVTAYLDDVLIYTSGSRREHEAKVRLVLDRLAEAGLHLDPKKCVFAATEVTYLGFIVRAGEGISCDPEKQRAIREWAAPTALKGVQSFLGFANYYRIFIPDFAEIAGPLIALTKKGAPFVWGRSEEAAFERLKNRFCNAPILRDWDPDRPTFVEADASGVAIGGCLSQEDKFGNRYATAFHSQRLSSAERNYPIHDREMLAIIRCLEAWRAQLRSCGHFTVISDHKNLSKFATKRHLSSRQVRWAEYLAEFDWSLVYRPGNDSPVPDALSRRDEDESSGGSGGAWMQLLPASALQPYKGAVLGEEEIRSDIALRPLQDGTAAVATTSRDGIPEVFPEDQELQGLWEIAWQQDETYHQALEAITRGDRVFPASLKLKTNIAECSVDEKGRLCFRERIWVPGGGGIGEDETDTLRGRLVDVIHRSLCIGHPGRDATVEAVGRRFYWPRYAQLVRRYVQRCDTCGRNTIWRNAKQGYLKPLPVPERFRSDIAIDFMTNLPRGVTTGATNCMVIVDRLSRNITVEPMVTIEAEAVARRFMWAHVRWHGMPKSIVSDRGTQWTSDFWRYLCQISGIKQRLSTAYHPQTDGHPERANQEIQAYLRCYVNFSQGDWDDLLPAAQLALNSRVSSATGLSPFFAEHGYWVEPIEVAEGASRPLNSREEAAERFVKRIQETTSFVQAAAAATSQKYEDEANQRRRQGYKYAVGDWVWLDTRNYKSARPSKKLDAKHEKFQVERVISELVVELRGVPGAIYPRVHVDLLRPAYPNALPGQTVDDSQPSSILVDGEEEWAVQRILCARTSRRGRGYIRECLVQWRGYWRPTWERVTNLLETEALDTYEAEYGDILTSDGPRGEFEAREKSQRGV